MQTNELWRTLADQPVADLPYNNLAPLLQSLGKAGVNIADIIPFLHNPDALIRLQQFIRAGGFELTDEEKSVSEILDPKYISYAPAVLNAVGWSTYVENANRKITIPRVLIQKAAEYNSHQRSGNYDDGWRLVYCAPASLYRVSQFSLRHGVHLRMERYGNTVTLEMRNKFPESVHWAHTVPREGYYLINYGAFNYENNADCSTWSNQDQKIEAAGGKGARRVEALVYAQSLLTHFLLKHKFPWHPDLDQAHHWAANEFGLKIYVKTEGPSIHNDYGHVVVYADENIEPNLFLNSSVYAAYCYSPE